MKVGTQDPISRLSGVRVLLDDKDVTHNCNMADDTAGEVWLWERDEDGKLFKMARKGRVQIVLPDGISATQLSGGPLDGTWAAIGNPPPSRLICDAEYTLYAPFDLEEPRTIEPVHTYHTIHYRTIHYVRDSAGVYRSTE